MDNLQSILTDVFTSQKLVSIALTGPRLHSPEEAGHIFVKPVQLKGEIRYQFAFHYARKVMHRNLNAEEAQDQIAALLEGIFRQADIRTETTDYKIIVNRKREVVIHAKPIAVPRAADLSHDRKKRYLLPEDQPVDFLVRLGVMSADGRVIAAKHDKYRQINRFLEMVADAAETLPAKGRLNVVDFGCGKSYLTFALHYYLHSLLKRDVSIVGLDLKSDVVEQCNAIAEDLKCEDLRFVVGDVAGYESTEKVDMVVSLHACDTATDDALAKAVKWEAHAILSAPCCQHELFKKLSNETLNPLLKHGILKERAAALVTDSLRAMALELAGYSVQILEFIDLENTPKNVLIRAVKQSKRPDRARLLREYREFRDFWHVEPYLEEAFGKELFR